MAFNKQGPKGSEASLRGGQGGWNPEQKENAGGKKSGTGFGPKGSNRNYQQANHRKTVTIQARGAAGVVEGSRRFGPRSAVPQEAQTFAAAPQRRGENNNRYNRENRNTGGRTQGNRRQEGYKRTDGPRGQEGYKRTDGPRGQEGYKRPDGPRSQEGYKRPEGPRSQEGYKRTDGPRSQEGYRRPEGPRSPQGNNFQNKPRAPFNKEQGKPAYKDFQYNKEPLNNENLQGEQEELQSIVLAGRNPIREALKSGRDLEKLMVQKGELSGSAKEIVMLAKEAKVPVQIVEKIRLDTVAHNHQGMIAVASAFAYSTVEDILAVAKERNEDPFIILLDGITDPHNLGAIIRSGECAGAHGVIVPMRRSVGLTPAAVKASAGAVEYMKVARVTNLVRTIEVLQEKGVWVFGADSEGKDYQKADFSGPCALVIGSEGEGISKLALSKCDHVVALPIKGKIDSLNASVAAGILLYRVLEGRR